MKRAAGIAPLLMLASVVVGDASQSYRLAAGRVVFSVDATWVKIDARSDQAMVFQIPNPADDGTPESTNAVVRISPKVTELFEDRVTRLMGTGIYAVTRLPKNGSLQDAFLLARGQQGETPYIIVDRLARRNDVDVHIRVSWPILAASAPDWQSRLIANTNQLMSGTTVDGKPIGSAGKLVEHTHEHDGKAIRMIEAEE